MYMVSFSFCGSDLVLIHKGGRSGGVKVKNMEKHTKEKLPWQWGKVGA